MLYFPFILFGLLIFPSFLSVVSGLLIHAYPLQEGWGALGFLCFGGQSFLPFRVGFDDGSVGGIDPQCPLKVEGYHGRLLGSVLGQVECIAQLQ